ncbi:MAG: phage tail tape measure protein [Pseudomonadota bacterium]
MNATVRQYTIRLTAEGKRQLEADLKALGYSGKRSLKMIEQAGKPASDGLKHVNRSARDLKGGLAAVSAELPALQRLMRFLGPTALAGALTMFGRSALDVGRQFEAMMKRVEAATQGAPEDIKRLQDAALEVGAATAFTAMEAAGAIETLAKNGVDVEAILAGALTASVNLAGGLGAELGPSADLVTDVMAQFRLEASKLPEIADRITGAALTSKFGFDDLRLAIGQAGGVAGEFGVSVDDFLTALSATASSFASGSDAGTSFKNFLQRLTPQSKQAQAAIADLGLEFFDTEGNMRSLSEIAQELQEGVAGLNQEARNSALQTIFGTDAIRTALALASTGAAGFTDLASALREVSAEDQAQVRLEGLDGALKELNAAWEALQLSSSQAGGLDIAETAVTRLTDAIRFLGENFEEVEGVATQLSQALVTLLVGKGISVATAKGVAMRAAYIQLAASVAAVGTASASTTTLLARMGATARVVTGVLGGPVGLAVTAASLAALAIDIETTADRLDASEAASGRAAEALQRYRQATSDAAIEQRSLGGAISDASGKMIEQSRYQLQEALRELQSSQGDILQDLQGSLFNESELKRSISAIARQLDSPQIAKFGNRFLSEVLAGLRALRDGEGDVRELVAAYERLLSVGAEAQGLINDFDRAVGGDGDLRNEASRLVNYARDIGLVGKELRELDRFEPFSADWFLALQSVREGILEVEEASAIVRDQSADNLLPLLRRSAELETEMDGVNAALQGLYETAEQPPSQTGLAVIEDDAKAAREEIELLDEAFSNYLKRSQADPTSTDRGSWLRGAGSVADKGILDLLGYAEGTDRGRGYNETLGYGAYSGGSVNLINMTLREVLALQRQMLAHPDNHFNSSAVGRYQIVGTTLGGRGFDGSGGLIAQLGLDMDALFTPKLQDRLALELVRQSGMTTEGMRRTWEGLNHVPGETIQGALSGQVIDRQDKTAAADAETRARMRKEEAETLKQLLSLGDEQLAQLELENSLTGKTVEEQTRLRTMYELLTAAKRAGIDPETQLTATGEKLIDVFRRQADAMAKLNQEQDQANQNNENLEASYKDTYDAIKSAFDNFQQGGDGWKGFWDDMTGYASRKLNELLLDPVWTALANSFDSVFNSLVSGGSGGGGLFSWLGLAGGGQPAFAGPVMGFGGKRQDNIPILASRGEFMQPSSAVDYYGLSFMEAIRQRRLPRFANGGAIGASAHTPAPGAIGGSGALIGSIYATFEAPASASDPDAWGQQAATTFVKELPAMIDQHLLKQIRDGGLLSSAFQKKSGY